MNPAVKARAGPDLNGRDRKKGGYTLLELVVTLALVMIVSGGVFMAVRQQERRALYNAAYQLQADIRYAQRITLISGRPHDIWFEPVHNRYRIRSLYPTETTIRYVYFQNGVRLRQTDRPSISYLARGTVGSPFTLTLESGRYRRRISVNISGGRAYVRPVDEIQ